MFWMMQRALAGQCVGQEKGVGSTAQQLRLRDSMLVDLRTQNKALAGIHALVHLYCADCVASHTTKLGAQTKQ